MGTPTVECLNRSTERPLFPALRRVSMELPLAVQAGTENGGLTWLPVDAMLFCILVNVINMKHYFV